MHRLPLGEILLRRNLISEPKLAHALSMQQRTGSRLGDIMISEGMIGYYDLYNAIAEWHALPFIDLLETPPDKDLLRPQDTDDYFELRIMPWQIFGGQVFVATCDVTEEVIGWIEKRYGKPANIVITSPFDIRRSIELMFGKSLELSSTLSLWQKLPHASARNTMWRGQREIMLCLLLALGAIIIYQPIYSAMVLLIFCHLTYGFTMLFKFVIFTSGTGVFNRLDWKRRLATLDTRKLPIYTVLIPMYREAASLPKMLDNMRRLDYPACKLDIKLVLEADDTETLEAAYALKPRYQFDIIRVPPGEPRTKPKACNYALRFTRGEFLTIFDADDRPESMQLKKAVYAFRTLPPDVVCLQARLNYYNANDNLLTRFFSLEYTILFQCMLYGLERFGIPIPLGGTSNHIALERLKSMGAWDPFNVTEDADLGTRLAALGYRTAMLDSYTLEEAPNALRPWIRQRSRWIKGYMQTWLVHMRKPVTLYRTLGLKSFLGFQFFVGFSSFTFLIAPVVWLISLLWVGEIAKLHSVTLPSWLVWVTCGNLALNFVTHWYFTLYAASLYRQHRKQILIAALLYPAYLILHSIASYKSLWQLAVKPHFWEKTTHGVAIHDDHSPMTDEMLRQSA